MEPWNPNEYMRFGDERTRPSVDLTSRIAVDSPAKVIDLGCGPGNSTRVLRRRWPGAQVVGLDSSPQMIDSARAKEPNEEWLVSTIEDWAPDSAFDVVFSNAALQWLPDHGSLVERLFGRVAPGGALAFQIPSFPYATVHTLIHDLVLDGPWAPRMASPLRELTMEYPGFYYDSLASEARLIDMWQTEYFHVMNSTAAIVDWIASTGLRPFLDALESQDETRLFLSCLQERVDDSYIPQADERVLFPFKRTFVVAYR